MKTQVQLAAGESPWVVLAARILQRAANTGHPALKALEPMLTELLDEIKITQAEAVAWLGQIAPVAQLQRIAEFERKHLCPLAPGTMRLHSPSAYWLGRLS